MSGGIAGLHAAFYYFGYEHLLVNMYRYIKEGFENNELVYLAFDPDLYERVTYQLALSGIPKNFCEPFSMKDIILKYSNKEIKEKISFLDKKTIKKNYNGFRLVSQVSYSIKETSKESYLYFEKGATEAFKGTNSSLLCIYDFEDFIYQKKIY